MTYWALGRSPSARTRADSCPTLDYVVSGTCSRVAPTPGMIMTWRVSLPTRHRADRAPGARTPTSEDHALTAGVQAGRGPDDQRRRRHVSYAYSRHSARSSPPRSRPRQRVAAGASAAVPSKVTSLGDSITQAFQTCSQAFTNCPENSWATGTSSTVKSIFFRIKEKNSKATETNRSVTGAKVGSLNEQAQKAVSDKAEFVTILIGANDACANPSTSQSSFSSSFQAAINTLEEGLPGVRIYVGSVPNLFHLWEVFHTNSTATSSWESTKECPGIMTEPTSEGTRRQSQTGGHARGRGRLRRDDGEHLQSGRQLPVGQRHVLQRKIRTI